MIEVAGWLGAGLLAICAIPQCIQSLRLGHSHGVNLAFLWTWYLGEIFMLIHIWSNASEPLLANYLANTLFISVIIWYRYFPRRK